MILKEVIWKWILRHKRSVQRTDLQIEELYMNTPIHPHKAMMMTTSMYLRGIILI